MVYSECEYVYSKYFLNNSEYRYVYSECEYFF